VQLRKRRVGVGLVGLVGAVVLDDGGDVVGDVEVDLVELLILGVGVLMFGVEHGERMPVSEEPVLGDEVVGGIRCTWAREVRVYQPFVVVKAK
jgi:hypothetical protein